MNLRSGGPQGHLDIFARIREETKRQLDRREGRARADLIDGNVIELSLAICTATLVLEDQQEVRAIRAENRGLVATNVVDRIVFAL